MTFRNRQEFLIRFCKIRNGSIPVFTASDEEISRHAFIPFILWKFSFVLVFLSTCVFVYTVSWSCRFSKMTLLVYRKVSTVLIYIRYSSSLNKVNYLAKLKSNHKTIHGMTFVLIHAYQILDSHFGMLKFEGCINYFITLLLSIFSYYLDWLFP